VVSVNVVPDLELLEFPGPPGYFMLIGDIPILPAVDNIDISYGPFISWRKRFL
jgi:hypothetical protein